MTSLGKFLIESKLPGKVQTISKKDFPPIKKIRNIIASVIIPI